MSLFEKAKGIKLEKKSVKVRNIGYYGVIVTLLLIAFIGLMFSASKYKKEVDVVALKNEIGNSIITEKDIKKYTLVEKDLKEGMILWKDRIEKVVNKYPSMQIRVDTPIYEDMLTDEQIIRYKYLYELKPDEELLTFRYNPEEAGGRIPRPGDRFRIRGSYTIDKEIVERTKQELQQSGNFGDDTIVGNVRTAIIFDVVTVVDMLNSEGDSIYEIRAEAESLPLDMKEKLYKDDKFKESITPAALLIIVKSDQMNKFTEFQSNAGAVYTLTILSRDESLMEDDIKTGKSIYDLNIGGSE